MRLFGVRCVSGGVFRVMCERSLSLAPAERGVAV